MSRNMTLRQRTTLQYRSRSRATTHRIAARSIAEAMPPMGTLCILLTGDLGAGKTEFVKGVARALRFNERTVHSPTFVCAAEHRRAGVVLRHLDLYRCPSAASADAVLRDALEDAAADGDRGERTVICVEWADRLSVAMRRALARRVDRCISVALHLDASDGTRDVRVELRS